MLALVVAAVVRVAICTVRLPIATPRSSSICANSAEVGAAICAVRTAEGGVLKSGGKEVLRDRVGEDILLSSSSLTFFSM